jgi:hypothetical protein
MVSPGLRLLISSLIPKFRDADAALIFGREINDRGQNGANDDPEQLIPIKERHTDPRWLKLIVEWRPDDREELDHEEQVPPAPSAALAALLIAVLQAHIAPRRSVPIRAKRAVARSLRHHNRGIPPNQNVIMSRCNIGISASNGVLATRARPSFANGITFSPVATGLDPVAHAKAQLLKPVGSFE